MSINRSLVRVLFVCLMMTGGSLPAFAQDAPPNEASVGYNLLRFDEETYGSGWYADYARNVTPVFGVVGQITGNYKSFDDFDELGVEADSSIYSFMAGVRVSGRSNPMLVPFGQVLFGGVRSSVSTEVAGVDFDESSTEAALQIGGGVNFMGAGAIGLRVGVDYLRVFTEGEGTNVFRFAAGVVFGF
jgi:hypothetical protein